LSRATGGAGSGISGLSRQPHGEVRAIGRAGAAELVPNRGDGGAQFRAGLDPEGERHARQPFLGPSGSIAPEIHWNNLILEEVHELACLGPVACLLANVVVRGALSQSPTQAGRVRFIPPAVELARPGKVVARNTIASMQAGLVYGYAGMVDALVERIRAEVDFPARCIATGGLAALIATEAKTIEATDDLLTLKGLKILYSRNLPAHQP